MGRGNFGGCPAYQMHWESQLWCMQLNGSFNCQQQHAEKGTVQSPITASVIAVAWCHIVLSPVKNLPINHGQILQPFIEILWPLVINTIASFSMPVFPVKLKHPAPSPFSSSTCSRRETLGISRMPFQLPNPQEENSKVLNATLDDLACVCVPRFMSC